MTANTIPTKNSQVTISGQEYIVREICTADEMEKKELHGFARVMRETGKSHYIILTKLKGSKCFLTYRFEKDGYLMIPTGLPIKWDDHVTC